ATIARLRDNEAQFPVTPEEASWPRRFWLRVTYCSWIGRCRLRRHHSPIAFANRRIRLAAVRFLTTALVLLDVPQEGVNPRKSNVPGRFPDPGPPRPFCSWGRANGTRPVLSGWVASPYLPKRLGSTSITRRASASSVNPLTTSSAERIRDARPARRG